MKVLVVGRSYPSTHMGMIGTFEYDQALILARQGCDVRYFFCDTRSILRLYKVGYYSYSGAVPSSGVYLPIGRFPEPLFSMIKDRAFCSAFQKVLDDFKPDIVHIHYPALVLTRGIWSFIRERCDHIVLTEHYTRVQSGKLPESKIQELQLEYEQCDALISVSEELKNAIQKICPGKAVRVVPNVISGEIKNDIENAKENTNEFIYVGKLLVEPKQVDKLISAFGLVSQRHPNFKLNIVGDGNNKIRMKQLVKRLHLEDKVEFYGNVPRGRVGELLSQSEYFVTASRLETFCVPVVEAWYCGLPVIVPDSLPILNYTSADNAIVFKDSSVEDLAEKIGEAIEHTKQFDRSAISAKAEAIFGEESVGKQLISIYNRIKN